MDDSGEGGELYDITLYISPEGREEEHLDFHNVPKETKVRDLLPQDFDTDNHPFRLLFVPTSVDINNTLEELGNTRISPVHKFKDSPNKLLSLVPVPAGVPPETDGNSDASSNSGGSLGSLYRYGGGREGKSKRKSKKRKSKRRKSKTRRRRR